MADCFSIYEADFIYQTCIAGDWCISVLQKITVNDICVISPEENEYVSRHFLLVTFDGNISCNCSSDLTSQ